MLKNTISRIKSQRVPKTAKPSRGGNNQAASSKVNHQVNQLWGCPFAVVSLVAAPSRLPARLLISALLRIHTPLRQRGGKPNQRGRPRPTHRASAVGRRTIQYFTQSTNRTGGGRGGSRADSAAQHGTAHQPAQQPWGLRLPLFFLPILFRSCEFSFVLFISFLESFSIFVFYLDFLDFEFSCKPSQPW